MKKSTNYVLKGLVDMIVFGNFNVLCPECHSEHKVEEIEQLYTDFDRLMRKVLVFNCPVTTLTTEAFVYGDHP